MATIYLSSTYEDLKDHRRVVFELLRKSGYTVKAMEDYVASDERPIDKCLKDIEGADVYVGIFAFRYGYIPPASHNNPDGLSVTELEFRHAERIRKPCLTFMVVDRALWPRIFDDNNTTQDKGERIAALREYLRTEKTASFFAAPYELAALVLAAVTKCLSERPELTGVRRNAADTLAVTWDIQRLGSPYPGLMHFTPKYASVFFGRDVEVRTILDRMCVPEGRFILISGNSGVGKSSIVDAGVLPSIERTPLPGTTRCLCLRMLPGQGAHPFSAFMAVLHPYATRAGLNPKEIEEELKNSPECLGDHIRTILSKGTDNDSLVLFMDQMEELFTAQDLDASKGFLTALYEAAQEKALWVLATIRSDHLHHCHGHEDMLRVLRGSGHYPVGPIEPFLLSDLIVRPARCAGLSITDRLARCIIHDMGSEGGHLPLLSFVLDELFKKRTNHELSETVYNQLGGINGAIAHHAAQVERTIKETRGVATFGLLPKLFQSLVIVNAEGLPTRRRPLGSAFSSDMNQLIHILVQERLLHMEGEGKAATVSISHEALFVAWPSLQAYVTANRKHLVDQTLLENRARKWEEMGKPLFSGLAFGREYRDFRRAGMTDTALTKEYLRASRRSSLLQTAVIGMVILLGGGIGTLLWKEGQQGLTVEQTALRVASKMRRIHIEPEMQLISAGKFRQGDTHGKDRSAMPVHDVTIKSFAIGKFEVTFDEYDRFVLATNHSRLPSDQNWGRGRRPVIHVSWEAAREYAAWLSRQTGKRYRLPTESEWEYAARSGGTNEDYAGTSDESQLRDYAVYGNPYGGPELVGSKKPNGLGLYDMSGNVYEWVEDCAHEYDAAPTDGSAWQEPNGSCGGRVIRGGSWKYDGPLPSTSLRDELYIYDGNERVGFRLAQDID